MNRPYIYDMNYVNQQSSKELFKVVSLFAGGGGSSTGYRLAGGKVLGINEFIPAAQNVYNVNYPDTYIFKHDVRLLTGEDILNQFNLKKGELDILDGSPPCASFSVAGLREKGWGRIKSYSDSSQRTDDLFFEYVRILKEVQPKVFVAENVKGLTIGAAANLLGGEQIDLFGFYKDTIYQSLVDAGYNVRFKVINSKNYGVPQSRDRIIFIGVRNDIDKQITYPKGSDSYFTVGDAISDLPTLQSDDISFNLSVNYKNYWERCLHGETFIKMGARLKIQSTGMSRIRLDKNKPCSTVLTQPHLFHWDEPRFLTIDEVIRICSFPKDYYLGESYNKKFERLGRAVPPLMMKAVAEHIYNTILK